MKNIILFFILSICINTFSQKGKNTNFSINKNTVYFETGGLALTPLSINYDRIISKQENIYFNVTTGFGFNNNQSNKRLLSIPFYFNISTGSNKKNHFEIGIGLTYLNNKFKNKTENVIYSGVKIGYKYQSDRPLFFKIGGNFFNRIKTFDKNYKSSPFEDFSLIVNIAYLSLGYSF